MIPEKTKRTIEDVISRLTDLRYNGKFDHVGDEKLSNDVNQFVDLGLKLLKYK